ncbi:hypothetical protein [Streptococcus pseudopneumoniae]|uniref:hypothetical protein n=1 Tax=Streptococcus pseudopneumoniae TaxID=257758 RepID=UPI003D27BD78
MFDAGVPITINSDDPTMFGTTLSEEISRMVDLGFEDSQILLLLQNGFEHSFLPKEEADQYLTQLRTAWESLYLECEIEG